MSPKEFLPEEYSEVFTDPVKQDISVVIDLFNKLSSDIELEEEEIHWTMQDIEDRKYKYINCEKRLEHHFKYALNKNKKVMNQIQKKVDHEYFNQTIAEVNLLLSECLVK